MLECAIDKILKSSVAHHQDEQAFSAVSRIHYYVLSFFFFIRRRDHETVVYNKSSIENALKTDTDND